MKLLRHLACFVLLISCAAPALADVRTAAFSSATDRAQPQASMFVGATFRVGLERKHKEPSYRAVLGIGGMMRNSGTSELQIGPGSGLTFERNRKPALLLAGRDAGDMWRTAKLSGGAKTALIVAGAAALVGVAALVVVESARCEDEGNSCD